MEPPTFEQFASAAQFGRYPNSRRLFVLYGSSAYSARVAYKGLDGPKLTRNELIDDAFATAAAHLANAQDAFDAHV